MNKPIDTDLYVRSRDGSVFKIIAIGSGPASSIKLENMDTGRKHWVSTAGLAEKYVRLIKISTS